MRPFYHLNVSRITIREYLFGTPWILLPIILIIKLFRIDLGASTDDPPVDSIGQFEVQPGDLPQDVQDRFLPLHSELTALGFHSPIYHVIADPLRSTKIFWATYLHSSGQHIARIHHRIWAAPGKERVHLFPVFCTPVSGGGFVVSSAGKQDMLAPKSVVVRHVLKAPASRLWQIHEASVQSLGLASSGVADQSALRSTIEEWHRQVRDFHLARGVFQPMTEGELRHLDMIDELAARQDITPDDALVHASILGMQQKKSKAGSAITLLVVSLLIFIAAAARQHLDYLLIIIPILGFHELGHYVTMRAFNYRNLNMFFIPFFGAAVTGQHYNVPGWKRCVVALAGPVPGIMLGVVVGIVALISGSKTVLNVGAMLLLVNGFNLLPVLPLDGGRIFHEVIFSRHPYLDTASRVLAIVALFFIGVALSARVFTFLCIMLAVSLPASWKIAKIAHDLRQRGLNGDSEDSYTIPYETATAILREVRQAQPTMKSPKMLAQNVLAVFDYLNARPPGALASAGLVTIHLGMLVFSVVCTVILYALSYHRF